MKKVLLLLLLLLFVAINSFATSYGSFADRVKLPNGAPAYGARVYIYNAGTTTPITIYTDVTGVTPIAQPVVTDATGLFLFYAAIGTYDLKIVRTGYQDAWAKNITVGVIPDWETTSAHFVNYANPHVVTKAQVGLGSADNTADASKPISTATQSALALKANNITVSGGLLSYSTPTITLSNINLASQTTGSLNLSSQVTGSLPDANISSAAIWNAIIAVNVASFNTRTGAVTLTLADMESAVSSYITFTGLVTSGTATINNAVITNGTGTWRGNIPPYAQSQANPWFGTPTTTRAIGQVYQNLTGRPIDVTVTFYEGTATSRINFRTDAANPPTLNADTVDCSVANKIFSISGRVLPGNYYTVAQSAATSLNTWTEWN